MKKKETKTKNVVITILIVVLVISLSLNLILNSKVKYVQEKVKEVDTRLQITVDKITSKQTLEEQDFQYALETWNMLKEIKDKKPTIKFEVSI